jgi:hypothetical protein
VEEIKAHYACEGVDLNSDGREEVLVYIMGSFFCGSGGCTLLVLLEVPEGGYAVVSDFPKTRLPVTVSSARNNGWSDTSSPSKQDAFNPKKPSQRKMPEMRVPDISRYSNDACLLYPIGYIAPGTNRRGVTDRRSRNVIRT